MNRQTKRMQARQKTSPGDRQKAAATTKRAATQEKKKRTGAREFLKQVRKELKAVDWPTREELVSYTIVVLVTVVVMTSFVFALDTFFAKAVLKFLGNG